MTTMTQPPADTRRVIGGVDTHKDVHVAAVLDELGRLLGTSRSRRRPLAIGSCCRWLRSHGEVVAVGIEGTGSWGAGVARHLSAQGVDVREVMRPNRQHRRRHGKSDEADAIGAARAVLAGDALGTPKSQTGQVEAIRLLRVARRSAMKARTQAGNQIHAVVDTAPEQLRRHFVGKPTTAIVAETALFRRRQRPDTPLEAARLALRTLARRWEYLNDELVELDAQLDELTAAGRADAASDQRCRRPGRHRAARRRRRQPRPAQVIVVVRRALRCLTDRRLVGPATTPPPQPLRRPPSQLGAARRSSSADSAGTRRPRPTWPADSPKDAPRRWSCAASNDTSSAKSTAPSPPTSPRSDTLERAPARAA